MENRYGREFFNFSTIKDAWYSKGQKMSNFTFDARSQQWLVQLTQKIHVVLPTAKNLCPAMFQIATVRP